LTEIGGGYRLKIESRSKPAGRAMLGTEKAELLIRETGGFFAENIVAAEIIGPACSRGSPARRAAVMRTIVADSRVLGQAACTARA
jgi:hypothetical protein